MCLFLSAACIWTVPTHPALAQRTQRTLYTLYNENCSYIHVLLFGAVYLGMCWKFNLLYFLSKNSLSFALVQLNTLPEKTWLSPQRDFTLGVFPLVFRNSNQHRVIYVVFFCRCDGQSDSLTCDKDVFRAEGLSLGLESIFGSLVETLQNVKSHTRITTLTARVGKCIWQNFMWCGGTI